MSIRRVIKNKKNPYTMVDNEILNNPKLSLKAKGLLTCLLSNCDDWQIYVNELSKHSLDGVKSIYTTLNQLIDNKYIIRKQKKDKTGKFIGYDYTVYESPILIDTVSPKTVNRKSNTNNNNLNLNLNLNYIYKDINTIFKKIADTYSLLTAETIKYYFKYYQNELGKEHPYLREQVILGVAKKIYYNITEHGLDDIAIWIKIIEDYFSSFKGKNKTDFNICHFSYGKTIGIILDRNRGLI